LFISEHNSPYSLFFGFCSLAVFFDDDYDADDDEIDDNDDDD